jgi:putative colanic acid biosynthesis acetyltransferase WcaF
MKNTTLSSFDVSAWSRPSSHSLRNKIARGLWEAVWMVFYRPSPTICYGWRRFLLRMFGGKIGRGVCVHPSTKIWAPWLLQMGDASCLGHDVDCYCVAPIAIGARATVSQYSYLCTASHNITNPDMPLVTGAIMVGDDAWVCADVFIGPGVALGEGAVAAAGSVIVSNVEALAVVGGNPARFIKMRESGNLKS